MLVFAGSQFFQGVATGGDLKTLGFHRETELVADLVLYLGKLVAFKFHDPLAVLADEMIVVRMIRVVRIVKLVVLPEIHFPHQTAFGQERERAIDCGPGNRLVLFPRPFQELLRGEMLVSAEDRVNDGKTLRSHSQVLALQELHKL